MRREMATTGDGVTGVFVVRWDTSIMGNFRVLIEHANGSGLLLSTTH
jgi:hypothetical protein